ncbi:MAG: small multi-drug export protein [Candidatus Gygaella obscura]|nr:small multi-drug export protein [Candidatus Gygaella obscura]
MTHELMVFFTAALPVAELRLAIPLGVKLLGKEEILKVILLSVLGNIAVVVPILILLTPVSNWCRENIPILKRFFDWLFKRTEKRSRLIEKYELLGLILFVGIPLPVTGAWTGCVAATLLKMRLRRAFVGIFCGILLAAGIVTTLTLLGLMTYTKLVN